LKEVRLILGIREQIDSEFVRFWKIRVQEAFAREKKFYPHCRIPKIVCISKEVHQAMRFVNEQHQA
jgi:hypothetical protein